MNEYHVIGIMSGSSLDGLDICYTKFWMEEDNWKYSLLETETLEIPVNLVESLRNSDSISSLDLYKLDVSYGEWIGQEIRSFIQLKGLSPDLIGIHGHTVFHEPRDKVSIQIGSGLIISQVTGLPVVDEFRTADLVKGGQGAPLVPAGEHHLFKEYAGFVNLGGIANIAIHGRQIRAWDVAPCNQIFNHFARKLNQEFDRSGDLARSGSFDENWFQRISELAFFKLKPPKSLSNQWREHILNISSPEPQKALHTYSSFLARQLSGELLEHLPESCRVLFTGGGTFNNFLIEQIKHQLGSRIQVVIPPDELINYKEALIFAFLGLLRLLGKTNVLGSVTGASSDTVGGTLHHKYG